MLKIARKNDAEIPNRRRALLGNNSLARAIGVLSSRNSGDLFAFPGSQYTRETVTTKKTANIYQG